MAASDSVAIVSSATQMLPGMRCLKAVVARFAWRSITSLSD